MQNIVRKVEKFGKGISVSTFINKGGCMGGNFIRVRNLQREIEINDNLVVIVC